MKTILYLLLTLVSLQNIFCEEVSDSIKKDFAFEIRFIEKTETDLVIEVIFKNKGTKEIVVFNTDNMLENITGTSYSHKKPGDTHGDGGGSRSFGDKDE